MRDVFAHLLRASLSATALLAFGCNGSPETSAPVEVAAPADPGAAPEAPKGRIALRIYDLTLPAGSFTEGSELWRVVDEQAFGTTRSANLWANGIRAGTGDLRDLDRVADALGTAEAPTTLLVSPDGNTRSHEIDRGVAEVENFGQQTLFWFSADGSPRGRTYTDCRNFLSVSMLPSPDDLEAVRVEFAPIVRSTRTRLDVRKDGSDYAVEQVRDEAVFDLRLALEVRVGDFLLIAPSPDASRTTSIGHNFFTGVEPGRPVERAVLVIPQRLTLTRQ